MPRVVEGAPVCEQIPEMLRRAARRPQLRRHLFHEGGEARDAEVHQLGDQAGGQRGGPGILEGAEHLHRGVAVLVSSIPHAPSTLQGEQLGHGQLLNVEEIFDLFTILNFTFLTILTHSLLPLIVF